MNKKTKAWLVTAAFLVVLGSIMFVAAMTAYNWDFTKLSTVKHQTNTYKSDEEFSNISIKTDTSDIIFAPSVDGERSVVCYAAENAIHSVDVRDGTLFITATDDRKWYEYIGINFDTPNITVYIPQGEYGALSISSNTGDVEIPEAFNFKSIDISESTGNVTNYACALDTVKIKTSTGDISIENISAGALDLSTSTGRTTLSDIICREDISLNVSTGDTNMSDTECKSITSNGNTGRISLNNVIATENFSIKRSTGDVKFNNCDAAEIFVETDTGDVTGSLLTDKIFITQTDTGDVEVPKTTLGGKCEISTDTGDIKITVN